MRYRIALSLCLVLLFVWSLPGTIALRSVLLVASAALFLAVERKEWQALVSTNWVPLLVIGMLSLWFLVQAFLISRETGWVLGELKGQWLPSLLALALGMLLAVLAQREGNPEPSRLILLIALVLGVQAILVVTFWPWLRYLFRFPIPDFPLSGVKIEFTFLLNILFLVPAVDLFCRATGRKSLLGTHYSLTVGLLAVVLICSYLSQGRNGMIALGFIACGTLAIYLLDPWRRAARARILAGTALVVSVLMAAAVFQYQAGSRWKDIREAAAIGWSVAPGRIPEYGTPSWPKLADGRPVEHSAFTRSAYYSLGVSLIVDSPLGHGYGRNAFGHALKERLISASGHAHSGWIDLGVGGGIPGLLLWAGFLGSLTVRGWRFFRNDNNPYGLLLALLATGHGFRMILDSVNKDHMLQMFMFLVGLLLVLTSAPQGKSRT